MNFTTLSQAISKRRPRHIVSGKSVKLGRPPDAESEQIRSIAWFNALKIALGVDTQAAFGVSLQAASAALGHKGWNGDLTSPKRWPRYASEENSPRGILKFINEVVAESAHAYHRCPSDLWVLLCADHEFQINFEDVQTLCNINADKIDFQWFGRVVAAWRRHCSADGLYEAVSAGLDSAAIRSELDILNVRELIRVDIRSTERYNLVRDGRITEEILMIGWHFLKVSDPIESYLNDPVSFLKGVAGASDFSSPPSRQFFGVIS